MLRIDNPDECLARIREDGFVEIPRAIPEDTLARINRAVERPLQKLTVNGTRGYVISNSVRYLFQTFAWSRDVIDIYTDPALVGMASTYSGEPVHLSNHRIYQVQRSWRKKMKWHRDNKIDVYNGATERFETTVLPGNAGLIFIAYLSDVELGGTQIVAGSHKIQDDDRENWSEQQVADLPCEVHTFNNRKAGTMLIYDYRSLHRAQPYRSGKVRTSIFGQYSPRSMPTGEPIMISTEFLADLTVEQQRVLNFGRAPSTENWPIGSRLQNSLATMQYLAGR